MKNLQKQTQTLFLSTLQEKETDKQRFKSLDPLEKDFDFERWAKIVKTQMIASLNHS